MPWIVRREETFTCVRGMCREQEKGQSTSNAPRIATIVEHTLCSRCFPLILISLRWNRHQFELTASIWAMMPMLRVLASCACCGWACVESSLRDGVTWPRMARQAPHTHPSRIPRAALTDCDELSMVNLSARERKRGSHFPSNDKRAKSGSFTPGLRSTRIARRINLVHSNCRRRHGLLCSVARRRASRGHGSMGLFSAAQSKLVCATAHQRHPVVPAPAASFALWTGLRTVWLHGRPR
jgi:hypothetical protein